MTYDSSVQFSSVQLQKLMFHTAYNKHYDSCTDVQKLCRNISVSAGQRTVRVSVMFSKFLVADG